MEGGTASTKKVMVVMDPTRESVSALQYTLSHALIDRDELILLHVENPRSSWRNTFSPFHRINSGGGSIVVSSERFGGDVSKFLEEMKNACQTLQPTVRVVIKRMEMYGRDKAATILYRSMADGIDLLIIGQRWSLSTAILGHRRHGLRGTRGVDTAEYLIENSKCTCIGVQRKGQNKGYSLSTRTHKNFWLLA